MDTSEEYIKMCKKAKEIQKLFHEYEYNAIFSDLVIVCKEHRKRFV